MQKFSERYDALNDTDKMNFRQYWRERTGKAEQTFYKRRKNSKEFDHEIFNEFASGSRAEPKRENLKEKIMLITGLAPKIKLQP